MSSFFRRTGRRFAFGRMLAILCFASGCGLFSSPSEYEKFQKKLDSTIGVIESTGGTAKKEAKSQFGITMMGWEIDLCDAEVTDAIISKIIEVAKLDPVFQLKLSDAKITDEQLAKLNDGKALQKTVELDLSNTSITDKGLDALTDLCWISVLNIKGTKATIGAAKKLGQRKIANPDTPVPFRKQPDVINGE